MGGTASAIHAEHRFSRGADHALTDLRHRFDEVLAENRRMTERLVKWIGQQALKRSFSSLADETGMVEGTRVFTDPVSPHFCQNAEK